MKVQVKSFKTFRGHDGYGWEADLVLDGVKVGYVVEDGYGGGLNYQPNNPDTEKLFDKFVEICKAKTTWEFNGKTHEGSWEIWLGENLITFAEAKKRGTTKRLVLVEPKKGGEQREIREYTFKTGKITKNNIGEALDTLFKQVPDVKDWDVANYRPLVAEVG